MDKIETQYFLCFLRYLLFNRLVCFGCRFAAVLDVPVGLLINFNEIKLVDGVSRLILPGSNR